MSAIGKHAPYINSTCEIAIYFSTFEELYIHIFLTQVQLTSYHGVSIQLYLETTHMLALRQNPFNYRGVLQALQALQWLDLANTR
jgi:hypothetical protein